MTSTSAVDQFILDAVDFHWQKVAMVVAKALADENLDFQDAEDNAAMVAGRVDALVRTGHLDVIGDINDWRFSEVRRVAGLADVD
jgi:hypothetical protein